MTVTVTVPRKMNIKSAEEFVDEKRDWIEKKVALIQKRLQEFPESLIPKNNKKDFETSKQAALLLIQKRLLHFNTYYAYAWNTVAVKNITSRWGSCSKKGNLSFSYRILFLTPQVADYLIVHELCHLAILKNFGH